MNFKENLKLQVDKAGNFMKVHPRWSIAIASALLLTLILSQSNGSDETRTIFKREGAIDFKNASILGNPTQNLVKGEEQRFSKTQKELKAEIDALKSEVANLKGPVTTPSPGASGTPNWANANASPSPNLGPIDVKLSPPPEGVASTKVDTDRVSTAQSAPTREAQSTANTTMPRGFGFSESPRRAKPGAAVISFPVKATGKSYLKEPGITLPSGSYVKAKLMTGVEAPEGKTYPVLMQLDYAYVIPNHKRLDLAGCFIIAKAQGDLSTERVQMQANKLSCVSKHGGMFEREVNGFIADDADNSFAVMGSVNTKQDRVAATAFLASIVSGIGKAIQQAQTTSQTTPLGGSQSVITGDQAKYIGAGGASEAATMVTQWYLKQAQNLLPTINVGSGQDVWVIMQDQVDLPKDYFTQNSGGSQHAESIYSHFTRIVD